MDHAYRRILEFSLRSSTLDIGERCWYAHFKTDANFSRLLPFLQSVTESAIRFENPDHLQFRMDGVFCALYPPDRVAARFFYDRQDAISFAGRVIDLLNDVEERKSEIKPLFYSHRRPQVPEILRLLPLTNCGRCGFPTCMAFAGAVSRMKNRLSECRFLPEPASVRVVYPVVDAENNMVAKIEIDTIPTDVSEPAGAKRETAENRQRKKRKSPKSSFGGEREGIVFKLSGRETEVLRLMAQGFTNVEMAEILEISPHTVKSHVLHIFNKLGVDDRTQAAVWAAQNEIL